MAYELTYTGGGVLMCLGILGIGYVAMCLWGDHQRERRVSAGGLTVGRLVQVDSGPHAGLCGWVEQIRLPICGGPAIVAVRLSTNVVVHVNRGDVSPLFA